MRPLSWTARGLVATYAISGTLHVIRPELFLRTMPHGLSHKRELIIASGIAEVACAAGLSWPRTRSLAGPASAALLVAIVPANIQMAVDSVRAAKSGKPDAKKIAGAALAVARVPLQWPLITASLKAGRR